MKEVQDDMSNSKCLLILEGESGKGTNYSKGYNWQVAAGSVTVFERFWSFIIVLCSACKRQCYMIMWCIDMEQAVKCI